MPRFLFAVIYILTGFTYLPPPNYLWVMARECRRTRPVYHPQKRRRIFH